MPVARKIVLQIAMQDIGQLTDFELRAAGPVPLTVTRNLRWDVIAYKGRVQLMFPENVVPVHLRAFRLASGDAWVWSSLL
jgi:hypothetical protein